MKIVVDTNIVFSAMLNQEATIGQLLIYGQQQFQFFAPNMLKAEIKRHQTKLIGLSGTLDEVKFLEIRDEIFSCMRFISEEQIPYDYWHKAIPLVRETDMDDIAFVVLSQYLNAFLWTGDKKLIPGLHKQGFANCLSTEQMMELKLKGE